MQYDRLLFPCLAITLFCQHYAFANIITGTTKKNIDFVEVIKQDLRRNNDDYKEMLQERNNDSSTIKSVTENSKKFENKNVKAKYKKSFRRNDEQFFQNYEYEDTTKSQTDTVPTKNFTTNVLKVRKISKSNVVQMLTSKFNLKRNNSQLGNNEIFLPITKAPLTTLNENNQEKYLKPENIPKFVNKNKLNKFQQFMKKNEGRLKDFVSSKIQAQTKDSKLLEPSTPAKNPNSLKPNFLRGRIKKVHRNRDNNDGKLPNPELLDMAPAKGGRIHKLRIKGRLCHRHVLVPEGPKYDSRGHWYLPAHELVAYRPYNITKIPKILLPRCCNCCKKSVLGCE